MEKSYFSYPHACSASLLLLFQPSGPPYQHKMQAQFFSPILPPFSHTPSLILHLLPWLLPQSFTDPPPQLLSSSFDSYTVCLYLRRDIQHPAWKYRNFFTCTHIYASMYLGSFKKLRVCCVMHAWYTRNLNRLPACLHTSNTIYVPHWV